MLQGWGLRFKGRDGPTLGGRFEVRRGHWGHTDVIPLHRVLRGRVWKRKKKYVLTKNQELMELESFPLKKFQRKIKNKCSRYWHFLISQAYMEAESDGKNQSCKKEQDTDVVTPINTELDFMKPSFFVPDFAVDIKVWVCSKFRLSNPKTFVFAFSLFFFARDCRLKLVFFLPIYMYKERHSLDQMFYQRQHKGVNIILLI